MILKAKSEEMTEEEVIWNHLKGVPEISQIVSTTFTFSDEAIEDYIKKYAKVKLREMSEVNGGNKS